MLETTPDCPSPVITIRENKIERSSLREAVRQTQEATAKMKAKDFDATMALRDSEFLEYHRAYLNTTTVDHPKLKLPESQVWPIYFLFLLFS